MFSSEFEYYHFNYNSSKYINTGILLLNNSNNVYGYPSAYKGTSTSYSTYSAYVYSINNEMYVFSSDSLNVPEYASNYQRDYEPKLVIKDFLKSATDNEEKYAYCENGVIYVGIQAGKNTNDSYELDFNVFTSIKKYTGHTYEIEYKNANVKINGSNIIFDDIGEYSIKCITKDNNIFDLNGNLLNDSKEYSFYIQVKVSTTVIADATTNVSSYTGVASLGNATTKSFELAWPPVYVNDKHYLLPVFDGIEIYDNGKTYSSQEDLYTLYAEGKISFSNVSGHGISGTITWNLKYNSNDGKYYLCSSTAKKGTAIDKSDEIYNLTTVLTYTGENGVDVSISLKYVATGGQNIVSGDWYK